MGVWGYVLTWWFTIGGGSNQLSLIRLRNYVNQITSFAFYLLKQILPEWLIFLPTKHWLQRFPNFDVFRQQKNPNKCSSISELKLTLRYLCICTCNYINLGSVEDGRALCELSWNFHPVLSPSCPAEDARSRFLLNVIAHVFSWLPFCTLRTSRSVAKPVKPSLD